MNTVSTDLVLWLHPSANCKLLFELREAVLSSSQRDAVYHACVSASAGYTDFIYTGLERHTVDLMSLI